ncbi:hypothetical protein FN846DRAFT_115607 [Sphaerosporella brunnea]|uniref:Uncharacterized protein n=1 Tax=Sphaerosporella brunnea TaxID=1250544 RepID=A0A5J5ERP7_9PEZI|nr:hypothetical protein FN846DRAFT_115607 [Sphaerosporella brunnea]
MEGTINNMISFRLDQCDESRDLILRDEDPTAHYEGSKLESSCAPTDLFLPNLLSTPSCFPQSQHWDPSSGPDANQPFESASLHISSPDAYSNFDTVSNALSPLQIEPQLAFGSLATLNPVESSTAQAPDPTHRATLYSQEVSSVTLHSQEVPSVTLHSQEVSSAETPGPGYVHEENGTSTSGTQPLDNNSPRRKRRYMSKNFVLPACRKVGSPVFNPRLQCQSINAMALLTGAAEKDIDLGHNMVRISSDYCLLCRYLKHQAQSHPQSAEATIFWERQTWKPLPKSKGGPRSSYACSCCSINGKKVALCKVDCFGLWHTL